MDLNGVVPLFLKKDKPIYVFSSHFHEDHFNSAIFEWRKLHDKITYILSKDIYKHRRAQSEDADVWLAKGGTWSDGTVSVWALGSTDSGVSWIVETEGKRIFHAGDLNNWYARFLPEAVPGETIYSEEFDEEIDPIAHEKQYLGELKDIRKIAGSFDVVMFPVDGRIGIAEKSPDMLLCFFLCEMLKTMFGHFFVFLDQSFCNDKILYAILSGIGELLCAHHAMFLHRISHLQGWIHKYAKAEPVGLHFKIAAL